MGTIYRNGTAFIGSGGAGGVELTQAEYDALPETEKMNGSIYFISDGEASYPSASTMRYDNSTSGLTATSVQAAVDEVNEKVDDNAGDIAELNNGLTPETLSLSSSYTLTNASFRMGKLVVVSCKIAGLNGSSNIEAATIPSAYAPKSEIPLVGTTNNGVLITGWIRANTGVVVIAPRSQLSSSEARVLAVYHI